MWNHLSDAIVSAKTINEFKNRLDKYLNIKGGF